MRPLLASCLIWLMSVPAPAPAAGPAIPQDPGFLRQYSRDWLAWNRQTLGDYYKKSGKRSPKWDEPAEAALEQAARMYSLQDDPFVTPADVHKLARRAVDAGCDDPQILYLYAQTSTDPDFPGEAEFIRRAQAASDALAASRCSPFRKSAALVRAAQYKRRQAAKPMTPDQRRAIEADLDQVFALLAESVKVDPRGVFWEARWYDACRSVMGVYQGIEADPKLAFDRVDGKLAGIEGVEPLRLALKGTFFKDWAWQGRGDAFAPGVSGKQFQTFGQRLAEARSALEAAYKLNPKQPCVARTMLAVEVGGGDDRDAMELWFRRALELDPNDQLACLEKHSWLEPKWHGDPEGKEALEFGRAVAATGNWRNGLSTVAADAYVRHIATLPRPARQAFFRDAGSWSTMVEGPFEAYLKRYPDDAVATSKYAYLAYDSGRLDRAYQLFKRVGDKVTTWAGTTNVSQKEMLRARDEVIRVVEERSKQKAAGKPRN